MSCENIRVEPIAGALGAEISGIDLTRPLDDPTVKEIGDALSSHIYKENNTLYPAALSAISKEEWPMIRSECDQLGYSVFTPAYMIPGTEMAQKEMGFAPQGQIPIEPGSLSLDELEAFWEAGKGD